jgi:hypothetical protein
VSPHKSQKLNWKKLFGEKKDKELKDGKQERIRLKAFDGWNIYPESAYSKCSVFLWIFGIF